MRSAQAMSLRAATVQLSRAHRGDVRHFGVELAEDREFRQHGRAGKHRSVRGSAAPYAQPFGLGGGAGDRCSGRPPCCAFEFRAR